MEENKEERIRKIISQEIKNALNEFDDDKIIVKKELNKPRKRYVTKEAEELLGERMTHGFELMSKLKKGVKGLKLIDL